MRPILKTILSAAAADGIGTPINIGYYKNNELILDSDGGGNAEMQLYFLISYQKDVPDFSADQADDNSFFKVNVKTLTGANADVVAGDTGVAFSGADKHIVYNIEANNPVWVCAIVSNWVAGNITLRVKSGNDNKA